MTKNWHPAYENKTDQIHEIKYVNENEILTHNFYQKFSYRLHYEQWILYLFHVKHFKSFFFAFSPQNLFFCRSYWPLRTIFVGTLLKMAIIYFSSILYKMLWQNRFHHSTPNRPFSLPQRLKTNIIVHIS